MSVQEDLAKAARAAVDPLYRDIERFQMHIMRKRERRENCDREIEAIDSIRADIVRIQKPYIEAIAMLAPEAFVVDPRLVEQPAAPTPKDTPDAS